MKVMSSCASNRFAVACFMGAVLGPFLMIAKIAAVSINHEIEFHQGIISRLSQSLNEVSCRVARTFKGLFLPFELDLLGLVQYYPFRLK